MPDAAGSRLVSGHPPTAPASRPPLPQSSAWAKASAVVIRPAPGGPTNAYACATRSVASARRSSATARGWSRIASSATQELLDARAHRRGDHVRGLPRAHEAHALGLRAQDLEVAPTHAPMEGERLALEAVAPPAAHPPEPLGGIDVEQQGEVRQDTAGRPDVQLADQVGVDAAPVALIRHGRVGVAVGEHHAAALEPRADLLGDVLVTRGHEQEHLDERLGPKLEQPAHGEPEARPVGFPGALDPVPLGAQPACEAPHLGRLARPLDPLERDEHSVHVQTLRVPQYATLARGPAPIVVARAPDATPRSWRPPRAGPAARWPAPPPGPSPGGQAHPSREARPPTAPRGSARSPAGRRSCGTAHRGSS